MTQPCPLCGAPAPLSFAGHWGFQAPARYDLHDCTQCETSFAQPMVVDPAIYDLIYRNADKVPGYDRYGRYRELLKSSPDPLGELCRQEDVYWAVREAIGTLAGGERGATRILEIGSGFGYLTYALRRAGYDCTGIDLSTEAVCRATRDFGDHYRSTDLHSMSAEQGGGFDIIVATELIEHVPDPAGLLRKALSLLNAGGALIVTTPNRELYPPRLAWHTDPPPVHLWWFSKTSFRYLGWKLGTSTEFVDFSGFYHRKGAPPRVPSKPQTFDAQGNICFEDSALKMLARRAVAAVPGLYLPLAKLLMTTLAIGRARERLLRDSLSLSVILRPTGKVRPDADLS